MGRNDKGLGAGPDSGAQLLSLIPVEISNPLMSTDSRSAVPSQSSPEAREGNLDQTIADAGEVSPFEQVARDMTLLAELVTRRRQEKAKGINNQDQQLPNEMLDDCEELGFEPLRIDLDDGGEVRTVDSIPEAIECLTTKWPIRYGDAFEAALEACVDGIKGRVSAEEVRSAFISAAEAAGIRINP